VPKLPASVHTGESIRTVYATDNSIYQVKPAGVALPANAAAIADLLAANHAATNPVPIVARGGGTGTNGQSLTDGISLDLKRHLNRILDIDPVAMTAIVEPGVVTAQLNATLKPHGLHWAPHTSTLSRATVGGMVSTDAAGKGSLVHGRAHRHVSRLDCILVDGSPWTAEPVPLAEALERGVGDDRSAKIWRALLELPIEPGQTSADFGLPELARGFSGYGVDRLHRDGLVDPTALLCGAEGTLAVITAAHLTLTPLPTRTILFVASYDSFADALDDAVELRFTAPAAIESFDETTLERGRSSPAWPALGRVVGEHQGAVLLVEYTAVDDTLFDEPELLASIRASGRCNAVDALHEASDQAMAWKVRADAVGLLAKVALGGPHSDGHERSARPTAFVEDCAVPVAEMSSFIAGFRGVLDRAGVTYGMFGHADVGCVHVRPALDLTDPAQQPMVRQITDDVADLVAKHGGILWGEHGRGFRGDPVEKFLSAETVTLMRQVKSVFDPDDLLNPGKLYRPINSDIALTRVDEPALRGDTDRTVPVAIRNDYHHAFACNGNGLCMHYGSAEVMCPSYKASGDPALSPKGRVDLLRAWLAADTAGGATEEFSDELAANLHECLSCSACAGHCPVEVDIPELKSRFLDAYYRTRKRPLSHAVLSRFEQLAMLSARTPRLAGLGTGVAGAALGLVDLPAPARLPAGVTPIDKFNPNAPTDVVIMPDVFTGALDRATLHASAVALQSVDYTVSVAAFVPSGKFDHVKGQRAAFAKAVRGQAKAIATIERNGSVPVVIEPAIALLHTHEYPATDSSFPAGHVRHLVDVLHDRLDKIPASSSSRLVRLLGHCTERATRPESLTKWRAVLEAVGHTVEAPELGCCGMAGIFGHEKDNQKMSADLWQLSWHEATYQADATLVATGYSCRSQAKRMNALAIAHPVAVLG